MFSCGSLRLSSLGSLRYPRHVNMCLHQILGDFSHETFRFVLAFSASPRTAISHVHPGLVVSVGFLASLYFSLFPSSSAGEPLLTSIAFPASYNSLSLQLDSSCLHPMMSFSPPYLSCSSFPLLMFSGLPAALWN